MSVHRCSWPKCKVEVDLRFWGCKPHWFTLPDALREKLAREYRPGRRPSAAYITIAREVEAWIAKNPVS